MPVSKGDMGEKSHGFSRVECQTMLHPPMANMLVFGKCKMFDIKQE